MVSWHIWFNLNVNLPSTNYIKFEEVTMRQKRRRMWVHDDFYHDVKRKCEHGERNMIEYTKSLTEKEEHGKKKKRY